MKPFTTVLCLNCVSDTKSWIKTNKISGKALFCGLTESAMSGWLHQQLAFCTCWVGSKVVLARLSSKVWHYNTVCFLVCETPLSKLHISRTLSFFHVRGQLSLGEGVAQQLHEVGRVSWVGASKKGWTSDWEGSGSHRSVPYAIPLYLCEYKF